MSNTSTTFISPCNNLRLVKTPARRRMVGEGGDFENVPGTDVQFAEGQLVVTDADIYAWLHDHPSNGQLFYELGAEPDRPGENSADVHKKIMEAVYEGNYDVVADILVQERTTLSRPDVIAACEVALQKAGAQLPEAPETPEHELERVRLGPAVGPQPGAQDLAPTT
ncbi:MAG: hypothetical protein ACM3II_17985, partial [Rhodospirillaceae bacterium]